MAIGDKKYRISSGARCSCMDVDKKGACDLPVNKEEVKNKSNSFRNMIGKWFKNIRA